jgi:primase-polymerase (primpol)-like protein
MLAGMESNNCGNCGTTLLTVRAGAKFCSTRCRVASARRAKKRDALPYEMVSERRFVRYTAKKVPRTVTGGWAKSNDPSTWSTLHEARDSTVGEGVGFMLGGGFGCIDLDHSISAGVVAGWAREVLDANPGTYVEVSRSGEGLHIFGLLPESGGRVIRDGRNIEVYSRERYIALTGARFENAPNKLAPLIVPSM